MQSADGYGDFMRISQRLHDVSNRFFFWKSVGSIRDTFDAGTTFSPSVMADVLSLRMGRTVAGLVRKCVPDQRVAQMIDHFTQYVGSAPDASPAVLCGIAHMQTSEGIWYPLGGTRAVPEALIQLGTELGVEFRTDAHVERFLINRDRITGIELTVGRAIRCLRRRIEFRFGTHSSGTCRRQREAEVHEPPQLRAGLFGSRIVSRA